VAGNKLNSTVQRIIQLFAVVAIGVGVKTMLDVPTVILPSWFLVLIFLPVTIGVSFLLAAFTKNFTMDYMSLLTLAAIYGAILSLSYYVSEYKPTYEIVVHEKFVGAAHIFLSDEGESEFILNEFGVGYISRERMMKGFRPRVIKNGDDITDKITSLYHGSVASSSIEGVPIGPYTYLSFTIPGQPSDSLGSDLPRLIEVGAIDTTKMVAGE
jgi:hypothetical protein